MNDLLKWRLSNTTLIQHDCAKFNKKAHIFDPWSYTVEGHDEKLSKVKYAQGYYTNYQVVFL